MATREGSVGTGSACWLHNLSSTVLILADSRCIRSRIAFAWWSRVRRPRFLPPPPPWLKWRCCPAS
eukprot:385052-Rhodomonas_salina.1